MLVQNFGEPVGSSKHRNFANFRDFCGHLGAKIILGANINPDIKLTKVRAVGKLDLWLGWDCESSEIVTGPDVVKNI